MDALTADPLLGLLLRNLHGLTNWSLREVSRLYRLVDVADLDSSFALIAPFLTDVTVAGKRQAAIASWSYLSGVAASQGVFVGLPSQAARSVGRAAAENPGFDVTPWLSGADRGYTGKPIAELNGRAVLGVKSLIARGFTPQEAVELSLRRAMQVPATEIPFTFRDVAANAVADGGTFARYRRVAAPGACDFCLMLASRGAVYRTASTASRDSSGERFHENCRCAVAVEVDPARVSEIAIDPGDAREISVYVKRYERRWSYNLGDDFYGALNTRRRAVNPPRVMTARPRDLALAA